MWDSYKKTFLNTFKDLQKLYPPCNERLHIGPGNLQPHYHDILFKTLVWDKTCVVKGFTTKWSYRGRQEYAITQAFNEFSDIHKTCFHGPTLLGDKQEPVYHFISEEITDKPIDFTILSPQELVKRYKSFVSTFDSFIDDYWPICNRYNLGSYSKAMSKMISTWQHYANKIKILKKGMLILISKLELAQLESWITYGEKYIIDEHNSSFVSSIINYDRSELVSNFKKLLDNKNITVDDYHFAHWSLYTGKVYGNIDEKTIITDLDRIGPQYRGKDFVWLLWSSLSLNTYNYLDFNDYKEKFDDLMVQCEDIVHNWALLKVLMYSKLIWMIFNDYGRLMLSRDHNRKSIIDQWYTPEANAIRGIQRTAQLFQEMFGDTITIKKI